LDFYVGEIVCEYGWWTVVQVGISLRIEYTDYLCAIGDRTWIAALLKKIETVLEERREAIEAAENKAHEVAGEHAKRVWKMLKDAAKVQ
jgi:hypothetical protein